MIRIKKWSTWFCLCICFIGLRHEAQAQLTNPSFETYCGSTMDINGCPTFSNSCIPGWKRAFGTPQLSISGAADGNNYVSMWSYYGSALSGEGIVAPHTFYKYRKYRVCFWVRNDVNIGRFIIWATNGVAQVPDGSGYCGGTVPSVSYQTVFDVTPSWNSGWTQISADFVANDIYTQIMIFPYNTSSTVLWVNVDDIQISEICAPDLVFNMTTNTSSGKINPYHYVGENIYAGSSAGGGSIGAGTVFSDPNGHVVLEGGNTVILSPNFVATPSAGQLFLAFIDPCTDSYCGDVTFIEGMEGVTGNEQEPFEEGGTEQPPVAPRQNNPNEQNGLDAGVMVYPNPTNGVIRIVSNTNSACMYEITTVTGQVLKTGTVQSGEAINIAEYATGIYLIKVTTVNAKTSTTHKIVKE